MYLVKYFIDLCKFRTIFSSIIHYSTNVKEPGEIHPPSANLNAAFKYIKDIQKKFKDKENEEKEKADLVQQDKLIMSQGTGCSIWIWDIF